MYREQVDRLRKEIAALERKRADELRAAAKERADANRTGRSITRSTSETLARSKLGEIERKQKNAADHEARAAKVADQIAAKHRSLTAAEKNLERTLDAERRKADREAKKRREADLRHLRDIEAARRSLGVRRLREVPRPQATVPAATAAERAFEYDVCLSLAGEDRGYVEMVAGGLKKQGVRVFYDLDEPVTLWGKDLAEHLDYVYRVASRYCVMFISEAYARKPWTVHERRSALARALDEGAEYVLPVRFDDTELPGLRPTVGYIDLREHAPATLVDFILEKLGQPPAAQGPEEQLSA